MCTGFNFFLFLKFSMPESIGGSFGVFDEFKNVFRRANPSFENISGKVSLYSKYARIFYIFTNSLIECIFY